MAKIFISHSSKDKEIVRRIADDVKQLRHTPWLDEWEIKVGDCIVSKIEQGIADADYIIIVLSPNSVSSGWVEKEWKTKYWDEIQQKTVLVLPVLIEDCEIPVLLKTKKYADFRKNYTIGFVELMSAISPVVTDNPEIKKIEIEDYVSDTSALLSKVQSRSISLSQCFVEALAIAQKAKSGSLETFCRAELSGDFGNNRKKTDPNNSYRLIEVYMSPGGPINLQYFGWEGNASNVFEYMRSKKDIFIPSRLFIDEPISQIESKRFDEPQKQILSITLQQKDIISNPEYPDKLVYIYGRVDAYERILEAIRTELTKRLLQLLPEIESE